MCRGDNKKVIETLQDDPGTKSIGLHINFTLIMAALEDKHVKKYNPKLRATFVELLKGEYVCYAIWRILYNIKCFSYTCGNWTQYALS